MLHTPLGRPRRACLMAMPDCRVDELIAKGYNKEVNAMQKGISKWINGRPTKMEGLWAAAEGYDSNERVAFLSE